MPVKIHGKEYFTVAERLNELNKHTEGQYSLKSEMVYFQDGVVVFKATLEVGENVFVGHAMEKQDSNMINKTSFVEVAETSSWGRALAAAGYIGTEVASADEVATAIYNQEPNKQLATDKQKNYIKNLCQAKGVDSNEYVREDMTMQEASDNIEVLQNIKVEV